MNYSEMSDFEINRKVLAIASGAKPLGYAHNADKRSAGVVRSNQYHWYDYCNSWADAGPIIQGNKITILHDEQLGWCAGVACWVDGYEFGFSKCEYAHPNPLRAAMVVFLIMQEKANA